MDFIHGSFDNKDCGMLTKNNFWIPGWIVKKQTSIQIAGDQYFIKQPVKSFNTCNSCRHAPDLKINKKKCELYFFLLYLN